MEELLCNDTVIGARASFVRYRHSYWFHSQWLPTQKNGARYCLPSWMQSLDVWSVYSYLILMVVESDMIVLVSETAKNKKEKV